MRKRYWKNDLKGKERSVMQDDIKSLNEQVLYEDEFEFKNNSTMLKKKIITLIAAAAENDALGKDNDLIWHISDDLKRFKRLTTGHAIIMGRKTFESMPKALPNRTNIVLTRNKNYKAEGALVTSTVEEALDLAKHDTQPFIIGGAQIYSLFMEYCDRIELTRVHHEFEADVFFQKLIPQNGRSAKRNLSLKLKINLTVTHTLLTIKNKFMNSFLFPGQGLNSQEWEEIYTKLLPRQKPYLNKQTMF